MAGRWSVMPSRAADGARLRTTPPGPANRAVTSSAERWDAWERRGDQVARSGRIRAFVVLCAAIVGVVLYAWFV
jgi:hypothetical protein